MNNLTIGILAHVDSGKTTLSEGILYTTGSIRKMGRVDNQDAFLDTYALERERGITIFSKQAVFDLGDTRVTLLDTPGHVDFSAEMERTLQVLDYAILMISGADGIQGHTQTLWRLLQRYEIPTFVFFNKMDQVGTDASALLAEVKERFSEGCVDFTDTASLACMEEIAVTDVQTLEHFLETEELSDRTIRDLIGSRKVFPCYFGSALKMQGVEELLAGLTRFVAEKSYPEEFGAKVFKIARDEKGNRLTYLKITGGSLKVKDSITNKRTEKIEKETSGNEGGTDKTEREKSGKVSEVGNQGMQEIWEEKINQLRIYSGEKYEIVSEAEAGTICSVTGLSKTYPGQGLGIEPESALPVLEPVLTYQLILPYDVSPAQMLPKLRLLEEEEPQLHILWNEELQEIQVQIMGEVQTEILTSLIKERFDVLATFGDGNIVYKETIANVVEGVGHFEPLRHYAEVHLRLEPGEPGSGLQFEADCSEDILSKNWQRLVLTHLEEREHKGVLTGAAITDMRITLISGRAHQKHTEGGDFRQATYRAVRQGLMQADNRLLEPYYEFRLEVPEQMIGRGMLDIENMHGTIGTPVIEHGMSVITGTAPVSTMQGYQKEVTSYTRGEGRISCTFSGYGPCHNAEEVVLSKHYDPVMDVYNTPDSVFCAHGAGFIVPWDQVAEYMHMEAMENGGEALGECGMDSSENAGAGNGSSYGAQGTSGQAPRGMQLRTRQGRSREYQVSRASEETWIGTDEIDSILEQTYRANTKAKAQPGWKGKRSKNADYIPAVKREFGAAKHAPINDNTAGDSGSTLNEDMTVWSKDSNQKAGAAQAEYLLVDGYNIIFAWKELNELAATNVDGARGRLLDIMSDYQGMKKCNLIVVFDAYRVKGHPTEILDYHNIHVVYTKEAETADQYIERFAYENGRRYKVTVATSDGLEQIIIIGQGCTLISAREFEKEVEQSRRQLREDYLEKQFTGRTFMLDHMTEEEKSKLIQETSHNLHDSIK